MQLICEVRCVCLIISVNCWICVEMFGLCKQSGMICFRRILICVRLKTNVHRIALIFMELVFFRESHCAFRWPIDVWKVWMVAGMRRGKICKSWKVRMTDRIWLMLFDVISASGCRACAISYFRVAGALLHATVAYQVVTFEWSMKTQSRSELSSV